MVLVAAACRSEVATQPGDDPVLRAPGQTAAAAAPGSCQDAFRRGHEAEKAGEPTAAAFLPSIEACATLAEWTAVAHAFGVDLHGLEPRFVNLTCQTGDAVVKAQPICREAAAQDRS